MQDKTLTHEMLKRVLSYDPETGIFTWRSRDSSFLADRAKLAAWNTRLAGKTTGCKGKTGYVLIRIFDRLYTAHRLAWFYVHGAWPAEEIDHINHDRADNRISNLRSVNRYANCRNSTLRTNNTSGICGVSWDKRLGKWHPFINIGKKVLHLGHQDDFFEAACLRKSAEVRYGFHPNHGLSL